MLSVRYEIKLFFSSDSKFISVRGCVPMIYFAAIETESTRPGQSREWALDLHLGRKLSAQVSSI